MWSQERLRWIGEEVLAPILNEYPDIPHGVYSGWRMDCDQWNAWPGGIAGHRDVPEQDHTDPGDLQLTQILDYALGDVMPTAQEIAKAIMDELIPIHDYSTGENLQAPRRVVEGYKLSELSLIRHHLTGEPTK